MVLFSQTRGQPEGTHLGGILALLLVNSTRPKGVINIIVLSLLVSRWYALGWRGVSVQPCLIQG